MYKMFPTTIRNTFIRNENMNERIAHNTKGWIARKGALTANLFSVFISHTTLYLVCFAKTIR